MAQNAYTSTGTPFPNDSDRMKLGSPERSAAMNRAYNTSRYQYDQIPGYKGWYDPAAEAAAAEDAARQAREDFLKNLMGDSGSGGGGGGGGASVAAYVQSLVNGIEESFNRQRGALDTNKANSAAGIQRSFDTFKQGVANNQTLYQQGSQAIQAEIARRAAESAARNAQLGKDIAAAVGGIGGNAAVPQNQVAANAASLAASQGFQQDLGNRLDQIVGANQRAVENSGELVRQGASGNLENNYNAMLNALLANREQQIAQAQSAGMSGGGGGGSKPMKASDVLKELDATQGLQAWLDGTSGGIQSAISSWMKKDPGTAIAQYLAMKGSDDEATRNAADEYFQF